MCAIYGALLNSGRGSNYRVANRLLRDIWVRSHARGRDGRGYFANLSNDNYEWKSTDRVECGDAWDYHSGTFFRREFGYGSIIGNLRAEPTTEYVQNKVLYDQQPYRAGKWVIVHNGTIANDKDLRNYMVRTQIDSAAIVETLHQNTSEATDPFQTFTTSIKQLKGSYAILAVNLDFPELIFAACNYRPIWMASNGFGRFFASSEEYFPNDLHFKEMLEPYNAYQFHMDGNIIKHPLRKPQSISKRALVVCSGGMDSVVAATAALEAGHRLELIHFCYGSRAEGPEVKAVKEVANFLGVNITIFPLPVYKPGDSPLLDADAKVAGGEEGAEFAHEWVPARNLLLLSVATAYAEANGFEMLVLGNNLEEAGAYPDNEPEFINRFNALLPFAVGDGKRMEVIMPVGNMMKHEIVKYGKELGAPLHLTWSCYRAGEKHCGTCGPCHMRRTAFKINNLEEVIRYAV